MKKKIPIKDLDKEDACIKVEHKLQNDPDNAYTISGLIVKVFGIKESQIENKPFRDWPKGVSGLYSRINNCLIKLKAEGYVKSIKHERAWVYYWKTTYKILEN